MKRGQKNERPDGRDTDRTRELAVKVVSTPPEGPKADAYDLVEALLRIIRRQKAKKDDAA